MIGIFGGTFDPVHLGHLRTALDVYEALGLAELRLVPLGRAVHRLQPRLPAALRLEMLEAAVANQPGFVVDRREIDSDEPSYTVHTLESLRRELGDEVPLCLLLGRDAFAAFHTWREPERILRLAHLVVMERPGEALYLETPLEALVEGRITAMREELVRAPAGRILFQPVTQLDISATDIRARLDAGRSVRWLVPEAVLPLLETRR
ncbi:MAG TPA: nicotinate-nucleotide adenylyltransferase [Thiolapillus brandeum]|uniref:Probable nicotinate-nucleotide adenylyltransferase n=1 Tax=Thiolapillus brandeum TaxID=1076588 RepID=A0A7C5MXM4_9GAMM|nr:nicotinate-nucleotide adenylyltransferase [Thiolapillus brandeum]